MMVLTVNIYPLEIFGPFSVFICFAVVVVVLFLV